MSTARCAAEASRSAVTTAFGAITILTAKLETPITYFLPTAGRQTRKLAGKDLFNDVRNQDQQT
jgi:hypothetical protein